VLLVHYFPILNDRIDISVTGDVDAPLDSIRRHTALTTRQIINALESGSRYHGYRDPTAHASLRYEIAGSVEFLEALPTRHKVGHSVPMTDYNAVMEQICVADWIRRGVTEVWLWGYHGGVIDLWESNMASPHGDISNSDRDPTDLPVFDRTYTVYHYNYQRGTSEAVEDHLHQIEAVLRFLDPELFWERFVGQPGAGRCGWAHYPPNGVRDYDWSNAEYACTDIEDWRPDGTGEKQRINCERWQGDSFHWFVYWMQNLPGFNNGLRYRTRPLTNWWGFLGDLDSMLEAGLGLTERPRLAAWLLGRSSRRRRLARRAFLATGTELEPNIGVQRTRLKHARR